MTNRYPTLDQIPGTMIGDKDDAKYMQDTDEGDVQGAGDTDDQPDKYLNKTEYEHFIDDEY